MDSINPKSGFNVDSFVLQREVRLTWIAFFTLWVFWGLVYFIRHVLGEADNDVQETTEGTEKRRFVGHHDRLHKAHSILFENTALLLSVLVLNTFGTGSTRAVMILSWIYFAFTVIYAITSIGYSHRFLRLVFSIVFFGITVAIGGLSFSHGW